MNTTLMILFLLLPAFPAFTELWQNQEPISHLVIDTPEYTSRYMSDEELRKQADLLKTISDPITRSRIVRDIGNSCNRDLFTVLDAHLADEKDPAVRADILSTLANLAQHTSRPVNLPFLEVRWQPANTAEYEKSRKSTYLPEKLAAEQLLDPDASAVQSHPAVQNEITEKQLHFFRLHNPSLQELLAVIDSNEHPLIRLEAIRSIAAQKTLSVPAVKKLQMIVEKDYVRFSIGSGFVKKFDHDAVRAAAYMALLEHAKEPVVAKALKVLEPKLEKILAKGKNPLLQEYVRQIRLAAKGEKVIPSPLPQKGTDQTFRFIE